MDLERVLWKDKGFVCLLFRLGHCGQHGPDKAWQRNFPQWRLDVTSVSTGWTVSCFTPCLSYCGVSQSQSTGSSSFYLPRAFVAWNWFVNIIQWLLSMLRLGCEGECVGISVSCTMGWNVGTLPGCAQGGFPHVACATSGHVLFCLSLLWNEGSCGSWVLCCGFP